MFLDWKVGKSFEQKRNKSEKDFHSVILIYWMKYFIMKHERKSSMQKLFYLNKLSQILK